MDQFVFLGWRDKDSVTTISAYQAAEVQTVVKKGKAKQKPVCVCVCVRARVIHYNQQMRGVDKEDQLLQKYLLQGKK